MLTESPHKERDKREVERMERGGWEERENKRLRNMEIEMSDMDEFDVTN